MKYFTCIDDLGDNVPYTLRKAVEAALKHGPCYVVCMGLGPGNYYLIVSASAEVRDVYIADEVGIWRSRWYWVRP